MVPEIVRVSRHLCLREAEVFAEALVLDEEPAFPKQIDRAFVALQVDDVRLERREGGAAQAEDMEEVISEGLLLCAFGTVARVLPRKADGAVADFVPRKMRHRTLWAAFGGRIQDKVRIAQTVSLSARRTHRFKSVLSQTGEAARLRPFAFLERKSKARRWRECTGMNAFPGRSRLGVLFVHTAGGFGVCQRGAGCFMRGKHSVERRQKSGAPGLSIFAHIGSRTR